MEMKMSQILNESLYSQVVVRPGSDEYKRIMKQTMKEFGDTAAEEKNSKEMSSDDMHSYVSNLHTKEEDWEEGDLSDRIYRFKRYKLENIPTENIAYGEFQTDEFNVIKYEKLYKKTKKYPPVVVFKDGDYYRIIDGTHRVDALHNLKVKTIKAWVGIKK